jgi:hypothetical protein
MTATTFLCTVYTDSMFQFVRAHIFSSPVLRFGEHTSVICEPNSDHILRPDTKAAALGRVQLRTNDSTLSDETPGMSFVPRSDALFLFVCTLPYAFA